MGHLETGEETQDVVTVAGRVVFIRNTGKLAFATLQEGIGTRLQVMLSLAEVGEDALAAWKSDVDLGDHVAVTGRVIPAAAANSVMATSWILASKALRPMPVLHKEPPREQGPSALRRPHRAPGSPRHGPHQGPHHVGHSSRNGEAGLCRGRNP